MKTTDLVDVQVHVDFSVTLDNGDKVEKVDRVISFDGCTVGDLVEYAKRTIVISLQRSLRTQTAGDVLKGNGTTILAKDAGKKIESPVQLLNRLKAMGMSQDEILEMLK